MGTLHFHRRNLPHIQREYSVHFITFCTRNRFYLPARAREAVLTSCLCEHGARVHLNAVVVMPDHVHLVLQSLLDENGTEFRHSVILQAIKGASAHSVNRLLQRKGHLWQEESFDRVIRKAEDVNAKMAYVLNNPVRKGMVERARDYRWLWTADPEFMNNFLTKG
ncbi:MAG: REP-associated tyrosine transposase [Acidobacteriaceae bacterium]